MNAWYSDAEIDAMCDGLTTNSAKVRHLRSQGLYVTQKPNGRPLVIRAHAEAVLSGLEQVEREAAANEPAPTPNRAGLVLHFSKKRAV